MFVTVTEVELAAAMPLNAMARAAWLTALLSIVSALIVVPAGADVPAAAARATGAPIADAPPPPPAKMPKLMPDELAVEVMPLALPPVTLPLRLQFLIVSLSADVTPVVETAMRTAEFAVTAAAAVLLIVRSRLMPGVFGSSPSMVTLSAPFSWTTPKPDAGFPDTVMPGAAGRMLTEV